MKTTEWDFGRVSGIMCNSSESSQSTSCPGRSANGCNVVLIKEETDSVLYQLRRTQESRVCVAYEEGGSADPDSRQSNPGLKFRWILRSIANGKAVLGSRVQ